MRSHCGLGHDVLRVAGHELVEHTLAFGGPRARKAPDEVERNEGADRREQPAHNGPRRHEAREQTT